MSQFESLPGASDKARGASRRVAAVGLRSICKRSCQCLARFTPSEDRHIVVQRGDVLMPVCPSCNLQTSEPHALFCAQCGFALPNGSAGSEERSPTFTAGEAQLTFDPLATRPRRTAALSSQADPRAVAVGLGALAAAVVLSIWLSYGPGSTPA